MRLALFYLIPTFLVNCADVISSDKKDIKLSIQTAPPTTTTEATNTEVDPFKKMVEDHEHCLKGEGRSPIDITLGNTVPLYVQGLQFVNYNNTALANDLNSTLREGFKGFNEWENPPYIKGATLEGEFVLWEYQQNWIQSQSMKWSTHDNKGRNDHTQNGAIHDYEGHLIHVKRGLTLEEAAGVPGAIVIVAVGFEIKQTVLNMMKTGLHMKKNSEKVQETMTRQKNGLGLSHEVNPIEMVPNYTTTFFTYTGSLTQAPCSRDVTWFVLAQPVEIPSYKVYSLLHMNYKINMIATMSEQQSVGSRTVYFNYGEQRKPEFDKGYPTYVLVLVTLTMVALTCAGSYALKKLVAEKQNAIHALPQYNDETSETAVLVNSEILFSL